MKKKKFSFRKWFFKLLTGYDLVEYQELLQEAVNTINVAASTNELAQKVNNDALNLISLMKSMLETYSIPSKEESNEES